MSFRELLGRLGAPVPESQRSSTRHLFTRAQALCDELRRAVPPGHRVGLIDTHDEHSIVTILAAWMAERSVALLGVTPSESPTPTRDDLELAERTSCGVVVCGGRTSRVEARNNPRLSAGYGLGPDDTPEAVLLFTSGTTGEPRGVRLSTANILANLGAMLPFTADWNDDDRLGQMLTVTHSFGLSMVLMALARDVSIVFVPAEPGRPLIQRLVTEQITLFACVPYTLRLLKRRRLHLGSEVESLRSLYLAGGGITEDEILDLQAGYRGELFCMYGFTEATARVAVRHIGHDDAPSGSVGLPIAGTRVEIVGADGRQVPTGDEGHIRVHSPSLMIGYLGEENRDPTAPVTTNDLGTIDASGHLTITGRDGEVTNFRGTRVSVPGLEAQITKMDGVAGARVIPESAAEDSSCTSQLVLEPGADIATIRRQLVKGIEPRGIIRNIEVVEDLPMTASGKLRRV